MVIGRRWRRVGKDTLVLSAVRLSLNVTMAPPTEGACWNSASTALNSNGRGKRLSCCRRKRCAIWTPWNPRSVSRDAQAERGGDALRLRVAANRKLGAPKQASRDIL